MAIDYTIYGRYTEATLRGYHFMYAVPAQALLLTATTGNVPTLINPASSNKVFVPTRFVMSFVSGTTTIGSVLIAETLNIGGSVATGAPILTATLVAGQNCYRGGPVASSVMNWSPTTNTFTAAPTVRSATSLNLGAADPTNSGFEHTHQFDGSFAVYPGNAMSMVYSVTTSTSLYIMTLYGLELPLPLF